MMSPFHSRHPRYPRHPINLNDQEKNLSPHVVIVSSVVAAPTQITLDSSSVAVMTRNPCVMVKQLQFVHGLALQFPLLLLIIRLLRNSNSTKSGTMIGTFIITC